MSTPAIWRRVQVLKSVRCLLAVARLIVGFNVSCELALGEQNRLSLHGDEQGSLVRVMRRMRI
jgi:hypothetical protein